MSSSDPISAKHKTKAQGKSPRHHADGTPAQDQGLWQSLITRVTARPFALAIPMVIMALMLMNVTLVDGHYVPVLIIALLFTITADVILIYAAWRGPLVPRVIALAFLLIPTQFVVSEFIRRAPSVFGW